MGGSSGNNNKWVWYGLGILFLWMWIQMVRARESKKRHREIRQQQHRETLIPVTESIFVSLTCFQNDIYDTVKSLQKLFTLAYAPHRIFVGLCGNVPGIYSQYQAMSQAIPEHDYSDQIRSFVSPDFGKPGGYLSARGFLTTRLYRREKYVLQLDSACMNLVPEWDQLLIENLEMAARVARKPPLLTAPPVYWATKKPKPTFSRFGGFGAGSVPGLAAAAFATKKIRQPVPALFVSSYFLFSAGPVPPNAFVTQNDASLSAILYETYDFFHPICAIVLNSMTGPAPFLLDASGVTTTVTPTNRNFTVYSGVDLSKYSTSIRALAGLNNIQADAEQVRQKYGSWKNYMAILTLLGGGGSGQSSE